MFICIILLSQIAHAIEDPCAGSNALLSLVNRPTKADSACVVPFQQGVIETGYQYAHVIGGIKAQNYPEAIFRLGLPLNNEFVILFPNYNLQSVKPHSGYSPSGFALKHEVGYNEHWLGSIEGGVIVPSGGGAFGSDHYDGVVNTIINYKINAAWTLSAMLGVSSQSLSPLAGSKRFISFNPDFIVSWAPIDKYDFYFEVFGQTKTAPGQGCGFIANGGVLYLLTPSIEVDVEYGHRLNGKLAGVIDYYGAGLSLLL